MDNKKLNERIVDAGVALAFNTKGAGIAGVWAEHLRPHIRFSEDTPTWGVDGKAVHINPKWTETLSVAELQFLIAHEALHIGLDHIAACKIVGASKPEDFKLLNIAQDAIINQALISDGIGSMPGGAKAGVTLKMFQDEGYTGPADSLVLYEWLKEEMKNNPSGGASQVAGEADGEALNGCSPKGMPGDESDESEGEGGEGKDTGSHKAARSKIKQERAAATLREAAMKAGSGTSAVAALLTPRPTRASIRQVIKAGFERASVHARNRVQPSYSRASRRVASDGIIMPGKIGTEARVAFIGDVSGSMSGEGLEKLLGMISSVAAEFPDVTVYLVTHTDEVVWKGFMKAGGDKAAALKATAFTGGTDFKPAYDVVRALPRMDVTVHFTDGFNSGPWPEKPSRELVVAQWGTGQGATPPPVGARMIPVEGL